MEEDSPPTDTSRDVGNGSTMKIITQKIKVAFAIISNGRYDRAAKMDANAIFPPVALALFAMMLGVEFCEEVCGCTYAARGEGRM